MAGQVTWPPPGVTQRMLDLKSLADLVRAMRDDDDAAPHLARYLVVRSAGMIEAIRDDVADSYSKQVAHVRVHSRVVDALRKGQGVRPSQLVEFVTTFDANWGQELQDWLDGPGADQGVALASLVGARRKLAHGNAASLGMSSALKWADAAREVSNWLIARFDPR